MSRGDRVISIQKNRVYVLAKKKSGPKTKARIDFEVLNISNGKRRIITRDIDSLCLLNSYEVIVKYNDTEIPSAIYTLSDTDIRLTKQVCLKEIPSMGWSYLSADAHFLYILVRDVGIHKVDLSFLEEEHPVITWGKETLRVLDDRNKDEIEEDESKKNESKNFDEIDEPHWCV
eukprot:Trichotokara_eunicae@DN1516_c0_g1_i1.p1